jgi:hypothetical protein
MQRQAGRVGGDKVQRIGGGPEAARHEVSQRGGGRRSEFGRHAQRGAQFAGGKQPGAVEVAGGVRPRRDHLQVPAEKRGVAGERKQRRDEEPASGGGAHGSFQRPMLPTVVTRVHGPGQRRRNAVSSSVWKISA